jgi:hypothetical protein
MLSVRGSTTWCERRLLSTSPGAGASADPDDVCGGGPIRKVAFMAVARLNRG